jgi:ornithine carbamoyltransferase
MKNLLSITNLSKEIIEHIFELSGKYYHPTNQLQGRNIVFAFEKPSLRTKIATEVAISQLGWHVIHIEPQVFYGGKVFSVENEKKLNEWREALKDTVKNINEWCDALFARVFSHETLLDIDSYSDLKIVNALCNKHHPMQALADLYIIREIYGCAKVIVAFIGDSNNVAFSFAEILLKFGHEVRIASPNEYSFKSKRREHLYDLARQNNTEIIFTDHLKIAASGADCIYTDTFISMWEESLYDEKKRHFNAYQVNKLLMDSTGKKSHFMHCLPAHRGEEVTDDVIDSQSSLVYRQARNRMTVSRGVFLTLFDI